MSGKKSLEQVWQQMQAQQAAELQRRMAQEQALYEQREMARQEYLQRMRMFEAQIGPNTPTSSSSAGGSLRRQVKLSTFDQSILYSNFDNGVFSYFIYNFETDVLTDIKSINLPNVPSVYPVTRGGFFLSSYNSNNDNYEFLYLNLLGDIIWQDSSYDDSNYDIEVFSRYIAAYYLASDGVTWKLEVFDENSNQRSFTFENYIEGGGYSYDDVWSGGFIVREEIGTIENFYIINFELGTATLFTQIDTDLGESLNVYQYAFSDKILTRKDSSLFEVWNSSGVRISEFDIYSEFQTSIWYLDTFVFLDENGSILIIGYDEDNDQYTVIFFSGVSNQFSSKLSNGLNLDWEIDGQKSYIYTSNFDPKGSALILFYNNSNEINSIDYYDEAYLLPIWSTDTQLRDLYTFSSSSGLVDIDGVTTTRSEDYINLIIDLDDQDTNYSVLRLNREGESTTLLPTNISKTWRYYDIVKIGSKSIVSLDRQVTVDEQTFGWDDLSDVDDRFYYSLSESVDYNFQEAVDNSLQLVMKDVVNDQYWGIQFTEWGDGVTANFAWTRQLIEGGTFSGEIISFTFSGWEDGVADVISPGVLEIKRSLFGDLYNSVLEGESNNRNPKGTLWNSEQISFNNIDEYQFSIIGLDGNLIDSVILSENYDYEYEGKTFILEDEVFSKTWISNNQNSSQFQLLDDYYTKFDDTNNISNELGLRPGYFLINSGLKYRFVSEDSISSEITVPSTGENFTKIENSEPFYNGFFVYTLDDINNNFYFYDENANLISQKTISIIDLDNYTDHIRGKRASIRFAIDGVENVLFFNGKKLIEVNTNLDNLSVSLNDYNWWD